MGGVGRLLPPTRFPLLLYLESSDQVKVDLVNLREI